MAYAIVNLTVSDFEEWKSAFDDLTPKREEHGVQGHQIFRSTDEPNDVVVVLAFDSEENARRWTEYLEESGELSEPRMAAFDVTYLELVEGQSMLPSVE